MSVGAGAVAGFVAGWVLAVGSTAQDLAQQVHQQGADLEVLERRLELAQPVRAPVAPCVELLELRALPEPL